MAFVQNSFDLLEAAGKAGKNKKPEQHQQQQKQQQHEKQQSGARNGGGNSHTGTLQDAPFQEWERAARESKTADSLCRLWKQWLANAGQESRAMYKGGNGQAVDFKTALLDCRALELSVEVACSTPHFLASPSGEGLLTQLLAMFLTFGDSSGPMNLADTLARLSALLAQETPDTRGAASRAVQGVIATLKASAKKADTSSSGNSGSSAAVHAWLSRVSSLDKQIEQQQGSLQRMASLGSGAVTKDQVASAKSIFKLMEEKFTLLQPASLPSASAAKPANPAMKQAVTYLAEFESVVNSHLRDATSSRGGQGGKGNSHPSQSGYKREETLLAQQTEQVASQIRTLEAQLRSLYSQQAELADKSDQLRQQQANTFDTVGGKSKGNKNQQGAPSSLGPAHFQDELQAIKALSAWASPALVQGSSSEQVAAVQASSAGAPLEYMASGHRFLGTALAALADMPHKVTFCRQRLSHAEKLIKLGAKDQGKTQRDAEKLLEDTLKGADELLRGSVQVLAEMNQHFEVVVNYAPEHASTVSTVLQSAEALVADIRTHHAQVQLGQAAQPPQHQHQDQQHQDLGQPQPQAQGQQQQRPGGQGRGGGGGRGSRNQQQQQQQPAGEPQQQQQPPVTSSPRTPAAPPRQHQPGGGSYSAATGANSSSNTTTPPTQSQLQGPAPVTPAPVPVAAPVVPHVHMHAPPAHTPPPSSHVAPPSPEPSQSASAAAAAIAASGGFEPAEPPVPAPASSAAGPYGGAAQPASAGKPGSRQAPAARPSSAAPSRGPSAVPTFSSSTGHAGGGSSAFDAAADILAAAARQQSASRKPESIHAPPKRTTPATSQAPPAAPPHTLKPGAGPGTVHLSASSAAAPAQATAPPPAVAPAPAPAPRMWAKPAVVEAPQAAAGEGDLPPTPAEAAKAAAASGGVAKESKGQQQQPQGQQQQQQGSSAKKGGQKKRAPLA